MKIRITPATTFNFDNCGFYVEEKKWWGWKKIYHAYILRYCEEYIEDLSKVRNITLIKD
jgi:hypothetical protein